MLTAGAEGTQACGLAVAAGAEVAVRIAGIAQAAPRTTVRRDGDVEDGEDEEDGDAEGREGMVWAEAMRAAVGALGEGEVVIGESFKQGMLERERRARQQRVILPVYMSNVQRTAGFFRVI